MPLSIAERLHRLPHGAQAAVVIALGADKSVVSAIARGDYRAKTEPTKCRMREIQVALAAKFDPPLPVWEVFAEWDGEHQPGGALAEVS